MSAKAAALLAKAHQDRVRGDYDRAMKRLSEAIEDDPRDVALHKEAIDIAVEAGESMRAVQFFKTAQQRVPDQFQELWQFGREKIEAFNDPILCKYLLDLAVRKRDLEAAEDILEALKDHTASDLLARTRNKRQSLGAASQTFKTEMTTNMMAEAMLCVRAKQFEEGAKTFVQILDDKPAEHQALTPYLSGLHKKLSKKGVIAYALGCSCLLSEDYPRGVAMLVRGAALSPSIVQDAVRRIEVLIGSPDVPEDEIEFALSQLLIIKGDVHIASGRLSKLLEKNHRRAPDILELLEPHVEKIGDNLVLSYLYVEAALVAGNNNRAIHQIKRVYNDERHRPVLLAWLDRKAQERFMTVEILARYGEMALEQQMYEKAIDIFKRVLSQAPQEVHSIKDLVARHLKDAKIKVFHDELSDSANDAAQKADGFIEHYGQTEFRLDLHSREDSPTEIETTRAPREEPTRAPAAPAVPARRATDVPATPAVPARRASDVPAAPAVPARRATDVPAAPAVSASRASEEPAAPKEPDVPVAAAVPPDNAGSNVILLGVSDILENDVPSSAEADGKGEGASESPRDFDSRWRAFEKGSLSNDEILDLAETAARTGRAKQLKALLSFTPSTIGQDTKRKYYLVEYSLQQDDPLSALGVLKTVDLNGLSREERRTFMLKHAYCYQQLSQFDAAHGVYLKILSENPDFSEAEHMAKVAYERHLASSTSELVLEKVTRLSSEGEEEDL